MRVHRVRPVRLSLYNKYYLLLLQAAHKQRDLEAVRCYRRILTPSGSAFVSYRREIDELVRWGVATRIQCAASCNTPEEAGLASVFLAYLDAIAWEVSESTCDSLHIRNAQVRKNTAETTVDRMLFLLGTPLLQHICDARGFTSTLRLLARQAVNFSQPSGIQSYHRVQHRVRFRAFSYDPPRPDARD